MKVCLSRMSRKGHVRFVEEVATSLGSPIPLKVSETREYLVLILVVLGFHSRKLLTE